MFQQKEFDYAQTPEVQSLYNEFVDAFEEKLIVDDFIPVLENACGEKCQILLKKLLKKKGQKLDLDEFSSLFNFELSEPENFECIFEVMEQGKGKVTIENLKNINQKYNLGFTENEMKTMITYTSVKDQIITKQVFRQAIS